jgi:hypothetical protein
VKRSCAAYPQEMSMAEIESIARALVEALNARDFTALAAKIHEDVAVSGFGGGSDNGREALRERLARHFAASDESYGDVLAMGDAAGNTVAIRLTARGHAQGGGAYSREEILLLELEEGLITRIAVFSPA